MCETSSSLLCMWFWTMVQVLQARAKSRLVCYIIREAIFTWKQSGRDISAILNTNTIYLQINKKVRANFLKSEYCTLYWDEIHLLFDSFPGLYYQILEITKYTFFFFYNKQPAYKPQVSAMNYSSIEPTVHGMYWAHPPPAQQPESCYPHTGLSATSRIHSQHL